MIRSLRFSILFFAIHLSFAQTASSQSCSNLFIQSHLYQTKYFLTEQHIQEGAAIKALPQDSAITVGYALKRLFISAKLNFLPAGSRFAISISRQNQIHIVSEGLSAEKHQQLLVFLQNNRYEQILLGVHSLFRNKYFEFEVLSEDTNDIGVDFKVTQRLAWDLKIPVNSQMITGFASQPTEKITPYNENKTSTSAIIRKDLMSQRSTQDTLATCGPASMIKVLRPHKIQYTELELLKLSESSGIRSIQDIFSSTPGFTLSQLAQLLQALGRVHGFTVREVKVRSDDDLAEFSRIAALAADGKNTDVIVNYSSPALGRPGAGHFTPIGGYNSKTKEVLLSEVNLAMNPAFWTAEKNLIEAMKELDVDKQPRGYLVITWTDPLK